MVRLESFAAIAKRLGELRSQGGGMGCVYCFRVGSLDRFKIGRTAGSAEKRKKSVSVGSPHKLSVWREIVTEHSSTLETYLHHLLVTKRAPNGEFFDV